MDEENLRPVSKMGFWSHCDSRDAASARADGAVPCGCGSDKLSDKEIPGGAGGGTRSAIHGPGIPGERLRTANPAPVLAVRTPNSVRADWTGGGERGAHNHWALPRKSELEIANGPNDILKTALKQSPKQNSREEPEIAIRRARNQTRSKSCTNQCERAFVAARA